MVVQLGFSTSGPAFAQIGFWSNTFAAGISYTSRPYEWNEIPDLAKKLLNGFDLNKFKTAISNPETLPGFVQ
jgi:hypothetical protein